MKHIMLKPVSALILLVICVTSLNAYIHDLHIEDDSRNGFFIENFGFEVGGNVIMNITNWKVKVDDQWQAMTAENAQYTGFIIRRSETDSTAFMEEYMDLNCKVPEIAKIVDPDLDVEPPFQSSENTYFRKVMTNNEQGFYNTYYLNCLNKPVSFRLILEQYNVDSNGRKNYLPAGLSPLPVIYGVFAAVYGFMLAVWLIGFMRGTDKKINRIHHLMTILVILKALSLVFQAIQEHYTKVNGVPGGWIVVYYIFTGLKTGFFFVLVALIGTGWSFIKPFLSDRDKKVIMVVIPLQVLDNIALIMVGETAPGSQGWFTWKDIFRMVDIICCVAVFIPIIWSIKHLREASQSDGKAARNLTKLTLFRQFYLYVVVYIYFTRIIIYLLDATLPFRLVWMGEMFSELAALTFFLLVGYKFRPAQDNPYFKVDEDEDAVRMEEMANPTAGED